ncbi:hypothetical protein PoB_004044100 [Plakobranchus ocellatus]|uniref:CCHC-type domain-containing protein n=1 Tax=Plakobranchus ocellatus TaxID=259542 RepID=A0AAV4B556_9GAST|nr:hypothetical protein PoB_004044100 [Plakobranchus ocellatus]
MRLEPLDDDIRNIRNSRSIMLLSTARCGTEVTLRAVRSQRDYGGGWSLGRDDYCGRNAEQIDVGAVRLESAHRSSSLQKSSTSLLTCHECGKSGHFVMYCANDKDGSPFVSVIQKKSLGRTRCPFLDSGKIWDTSGE